MYEDHRGSQPMGNNSLINTTPVNLNQHNRTVMKFQLVNYMKSNKINKMSGVLPPGVKRSENEVDHSPPSRAKVNNVWGYTSSLPTHLHGMVLN